MSIIHWPPGTRRLRMYRSPNASCWELLRAIRRGYIYIGNTGRIRYLRSMGVLERICVGAPDAARGCNEWSETERQGSIYAASQLGNESGKRIAQEMVGSCHRQWCRFHACWRHGFSADDWSVPRAANQRGEDGDKTAAGSRECGPRPS